MFKLIKFKKVFLVFLTRNFKKLLVLKITFSTKNSAVLLYIFKIFVLYRVFKLIKYEFFLNYFLNFVNRSFFLLSLDLISFCFVLKSNLIMNYLILFSYFYCFQISLSFFWIKLKKINLPCTLFFLNCKSFYYK